MILAFLGCCWSCTQTAQQDRTQEVKNLKTFAKLYGYVKYFHPSDEAYSIDWDLFAIHGAKQVEKAKNTQELKVILNELFLPLAPTLQLGEVGDSLTFDIASITPEDTTGLMDISWQHLGAGFKVRESAYWSMRVNRNIEFLSTTWPTAVVKKINAAPYRGKEFKIQARWQSISWGRHNA